MPRLLIQQVDLSWTSDICERAGNVGDVKVTDEGEILDQSRGRSIVFQPLRQRTPNSPGVLSLMECSHPAPPVDNVSVAKKIEHSVQPVIGLCFHSNAITLTMKLDSTRRIVP